MPSVHFPPSMPPSQRISDLAYMIGLLEGRVEDLTNELECAKNRIEELELKIKD